MNDPGFVCLLLAKFPKQLQTLMTQVDAAVAGGDFATLSRVGHSLKGATSNLSAVEMAETAKLLEDASHENDLVAVQKLVVQLHEQAGRCSAFVPELVARLQGESAVGVG